MSLQAGGGGGVRILNAIAQWQIVTKSLNYKHRIGCNFLNWKFLFDLWKIFSILNLTILQ